MNVAFPIKKSSFNCVLIKIYYSIQIINTQKVLYLNEKSNMVYTPNPFTIKVNNTWTFIKDFYVKIQNMRHSICIYT